MRPRIGGLVILLAAALAGTAAAQDRNPYRLKPGAEGKVCLGCHSDFQDKLKLPHVHKPVQSGECVRCHSPHASSHGRMLSGTTDAICARCHVVMARDTIAKATSAHAPVVKGECVKCHDPHAAKNDHNLTAAGNALCATCHGDLVKRLSEVKFRHPPVALNCLGCHDPHSSQAAPHLLKKAVPELCQQCHATSQPVFLRQHANYPVGKGDCTSCHDPHGSDQAGLLWPTVHPPVASKMCSQCHQESSSANPLATRRPGAEVCRGCHAGLFNEMAAKNRLHWPAVDRVGCLNCHNPHASVEPSLLKQPPKPLCGTCHADTIAEIERSAVKHPPADDGSCTTCHQPHASDAVFLLAAPDTLSLCANCHDWEKHSNHPLGEKAIDPRNRNRTLECSSCHRPHASPYKGFTLLDSNSDLCVQCHEGMRR